MLIRAILTIAVLASFVFGAAAQAGNSNIGAWGDVGFVAIPQPSTIAPPGTPWAATGR